MKSLILPMSFMIGLLFVMTANSQTPGQSAVVPPATDYRVVEQGADHNVWQREIYEPAPDGTMVPREHQYIELATGLNYQDTNGQWQAAQEEIETYPGGAIARQGQYQVIFADNLNTEGAIDLQTPDKKRLRSNILGLGYYDHASGQTVLIAQLQDSEGQLIAANQVLYPNAFAGVKADVRYTYKKGKFEQDVILREQPPAPAAYGLDPATTELEVLTEFLNPPAAKITALRTKKGGQTDGEISWGAMSLGQGKAFDLGEARGVRSRVRVNKQYAVLEGRQVLIEKVPVVDIATNLEQLPVSASSGRKLPFSVTKVRQLPKTPLAKMSGKPMLLASLAPVDKGYVLDYTAITGNQTNYTFQGDTTYYVNGPYNLRGVTTFEGGTVIKLNGTGQLNIDVGGTVVCKTSAYHPAVFTSWRDNAVGQSVSSGTLNFTNVFNFLYLATTNDITLHDLRFSHATVGVDQDYGMLDIWNSQFVDVDVAVMGYNLGLHNILLARTAMPDVAIYSGGPSLVAEQVTSDGGYAFYEADYSGTTIALTNCLVTGQALISPFGFTTPPLTNGVVCVPSPSTPIYQPVGGGFYYLTNNSPYRDVGTTNISPALLTGLASRTTYPPIGYTNTIFANATIFSPQAERDNDGAPDLGYHYDPLDYLFSNVSVSNNVTFATGTAAAWTTSEGILLQAKLTATFVGTATSPNYWVRANTVQEQDGNGSYGAGGMASEYSSTPTTAPLVQGTFTRCSMLAGFGNPFRDESGCLNLVLNHCEFWTTGDGGYIISLYLTNCLFERTYMAQDSGLTGNQFVLRNCTSHGGLIYLTTSGATVDIQNCAFDGTTVTTSGNAGNASYSKYDYNAYTNASNPFPLSGAHNVPVTGSFNWQSSWFGNYYLPTNSTLINAGNTTADQLGLYHFTTQTSQIKETNSVVDIGYHYMATDAYGNPIDTDGDGIPDYIEDANGNGIFDTGDLSNWLIGSFNGLSTGNGLQVFTPLK